ncbi:MAG: TadE/TadG family type IV pilus assembly protein [Desulfobaccales bacterium]
MEFALVLPALLLIICGIFDLGNIYLNWNIVNEAAREGARLVAVDQALQISPYTQAQISAALQSSYGTPYGNTLTVTVTESTSGTFTTVLVKVTSNVNIIFPLISAFFPSNPVTVTGQCTMLVE